MRCAFGVQVWRATGRRSTGLKRMRTWRPRPTPVPATLLCTRSLQLPQPILCTILQQQQQQQQQRQVWQQPTWRPAPQHQRPTPPLRLPTNPYTRLNRHQQQQLTQQQGRHQQQQQHGTMQTSCLTARSSPSLWGPACCWCCTHRWGWWWPAPGEPCPPLPPQRGAGRLPLRCTVGRGQLGEARLVLHRSPHTSAHGHQQSTA